MIEHGNNSRYTNYGCRCDECKAAAAARSKAYNARPKRKPLEHEHGTNNAYANLGCRCDLCVADHAARTRAYYVKNKAEVLVRNKTWRGENPESTRENSKVRKHRYRARLADNGGAHFTTAQLAERMEYFGNKCHLRLAGCTGEFEHVDHVKPVAQGGGNFLSNLRPACAHCNQSKGATWKVA
jgi:5-methylcytosine-specific restriction endonuclease McrA